MSAISYRHVRCFLEVARLSSVGQAAEALAISQPAVSKTLQRARGPAGDAPFRAGRAAAAADHGGAAVPEACRAVAGRAGAGGAGAQDAGRHGRCAGGRRAAHGGDPRPAAGGAGFRAGGAGACASGHRPGRTGSCCRSSARGASIWWWAGWRRRTRWRGSSSSSSTRRRWWRWCGRGIRSSPRRARPLADFPLILPPPDAIIRPVVEQHFLRSGLRGAAAAGGDGVAGARARAGAGVGRGLVHLARAWSARSWPRATLVALDLGGMAAGRAGRPHPAFGPGTDGRASRS